MKLSVIIPAYNERSTIAAVIRRVCDVPIDKELIIVDDGSSDGTAAELSRLGLSAGATASCSGSTGAANELRLITHSPNQGKGTSIRDGIAAATGDIILIQDADLEYDPGEYPKLIQPILDGRADAVYGSRFAGSTRRILSFWHSLGNRVLTLASNMFTNLNLTDMETCYKVFRADVVKNMPLRSARFGIEPELTAKLARKRSRIYEVPITYAGRSYFEGKKIGWKDGVATLWTILKYAVIDDLENTDPAYKALQHMEALRRYNEWLWKKVEPFVGDRVLEVGAGTGYLTRCLSSRELVVATDAEPKYVTMLGNMFENDPHVRVGRFDLATDPVPNGTDRPFDTVVCLNVLGNVEDDVEALRRIHDALAPRGRAVVIVPAMHWLYGEIDRAIGHRRRYERAELVDKMEAAGFTVEHTAAFNLIGALGWFVNARLLQRRTVPGLQARLNALLVPILRLEEHLDLSVGLSLLAVGRR